MEDEKHESKRNCHPQQKWLPVVAILLLVLLIAGFSVRYISFVSQTIYQESTSHLEEVLHKSNNMLKEMVRKNLTYLHLYNGFLESTSDEAEIQAYIRAAQQEGGKTGLLLCRPDIRPYFGLIGGTFQKAVVQIEVSQVISYHLFPHIVGLFQPPFQL